VRPAHFELVDALLSLELVPLLLDEGLDEELSLGVLLVLPVLGEAALPVLGDDGSELVLLLLGELGEVAVVPELMLPPLGGEPASLPDEDAPLPLAPDAPEELSPDELELPLLAPALAPPLAPPPCAQAAVAKATMAAVTAALMSFRFISQFL